MKILLTLAAFTLSISPLHAQVPDLSNLNTVQGFIEYAPAQAPAAPEAAYAGPSTHLAALTPAPQLPAEIIQGIRARYLDLAGRFGVTLG